jgi:hypothetical protein
VIDIRSEAVSPIPVTVLSAGDITGQTLSGLIGALVGAVVTVLVVFLTPLAQRRDRYDATILARRMRAYEALLQLLEPTSHHALKTGQAIDHESFADGLTSWYYKGHGLYMTVVVRDLFFDLRNNAASYDRLELVERASQLRTEMTTDLGSRRRSLLKAETRIRAT